MKPETAQSRWISVEESSPGIGAYVLVWVPQRWEQPYRVVQYSQKSDQHRKWVRNDGQWWDNGQRITHWQPLTPPPKGEVDNG